MYEPATKKSSIVITPYEYFNLGKTTLVWVIKGNENPDPGKRMMWGRSAEGVVSDFKGRFTKAGSSVKLTVSGKFWTRSDERDAQIKAVDEYIELQEKRGAG